MWKTRYIKKITDNTDNIDEAKINFEIQQEEKKGSKFINLTALNNNQVILIFEKEKPNVLMWGKEMFRNKEFVMYVILVILIILTIIKTILYVKAKKEQIQHNEYLKQLALINITEIVMLGYLAFKVKNIDFRVLICVILMIYGTIIEVKTEKLLKKDDNKSI